MKSIFDYEILNNEVFYKCMPILVYINNHPNLSKLDIMALKATIMDALVYAKAINPNEEFLNFETLMITNNPDDYHYEKTPNVCGIPMHIKEKLRQKSLYITGGLPITLFLAKPPSKILRYCVYDPNTAVSSIFDDFAFLEVLYDSPTRENVRLTETRPFVEVTINDELYLVDTITNRIFKSSYFKQKYNMEIVKKIKRQDFNKDEEKFYNDEIKEKSNLADTIIFYNLLFSKIDNPNLAETKYELEMSKKYFPEEWEKSEFLQKQYDNFNLCLKKSHTDILK